MAEKLKIKIPVSIERCNYCGKLSVLIDNFGECRGQCPGNFITRVQTYEVDLPERLKDKIVFQIKSLLKSKLCFIDKQSWDKVASFHPDSEDYSIAYKNAIIKRHALTEIEKIVEEL